MGYGDTTVFQTGKSAADLRIGTVVEVKGAVTGTAMAVTRIGFADALPMPPAAGVPVFETEGIASHITLGNNGAVATFDIDGTTFTMTAESATRQLDGAFVAGAKIHVVFKKVGMVNVVLLVNTKH